MRISESPESHDLDLFRRIATGESGALAQLYDRHAPRILGLLVRLLGQRNDAEDILQETFLQVWKNAAEYDPRRSSPLTWMFLIARSRALDHLRRKRVDSMGDVVETPVVHDLSGAMERDESARRLQDLLHRLPQPQRMAIALAFFEGLSHTQVAESQGVSLGTAKTRIRMGLHRLRDILEESQRGSSR